MRLSSLAQRYLADPRYIESPRSKDTYDHCIGQFITFLETQGLANSVESFTPASVEGFIQYLFEEKRLNPTTVNLRLSALAGLARYAMQTLDRGRYIMDSNPVDRIKRPRNAQPREKYLALSEVRAILEADCHENERLALMLIVDQPLRATEYCTARVRDLVLDGNRVALTVRVKGGKYRAKPLGPRVAERLIASLKQREAGPEETLLLNTQGKAYTRQNLSEMISRCQRPPKESHPGAPMLSQAGDAAGLRASR
jgi:integrase